ncbi:MAG: DUF3782 domain-containing protein [Methylococcales bacterium]|nr:DUF3782 domain-containing protein [Methylococcales bacterium]
MQTANSPAPTLDDILRLFQETDRIMKENQAEIKEMKKETERMVQETERITQETAQSFKTVNTIIGNLGNRLGQFVEEAMRPSAVRLFRECGIDIHEVQQNIAVKRDGEALEIDLLVVNDKDTVVIECKSNLSIDDVNEYLVRLKKVKRLLPRYKDNRVLGAVAGMVIPDNVAQYAIRKGLYVIGQNGDHLELRNEQAFLPAAW